jgi:biopolymer transport protein ExbD
MLRKKKKKKVEEADMDMTPMIDVTFLLLIFFLCLEFKTLEGKLATNLPKDLGVNTTPAEPIEKLDLRIEMVDFGQEKTMPGDYRRTVFNHKVKYWVGASSIRSIDKLEEILRRESKRKVPDSKNPGQTKTKPITIKTGPGVFYGDVTEVIDIAREAGFTEITFGGGEGSHRAKMRKAGS